MGKVTEQERESLYRVAVYFVLRRGAIRPEELIHFVRFPLNDTWFLGIGSKNIKEIIERMESEGIICKRKNGIGYELNRQRSPYGLNQTEKKAASDSLKRIQKRNTHRAKEGATYRRELEAFTKNHTGLSLKELMESNQFELRCVSFQNDTYQHELYKKGKIIAENTIRIEDIERVANR